jgi:hypothetical protein
VNRTAKLALIGGGLAAVAGAVLYRRKRAAAASSPAAAATATNFATGPAIVTGQEASPRQTIDVQIKPAATATKKRPKNTTRRDHRS